MTEGRIFGNRASSDGELALLVLGSILLRRRRIIVGLLSIGLVAGVSIGLFRHRTYVSSTAFIPQSSTPAANASILAAASQFGLRLPGQNDGWGPPVYVELLNSRALLEPLTRDTLIVPENGGRREALLDLLDVKGGTAAVRMDHALRSLRKIVAASEDKNLGAVRLSVRTRWPSVSLAIASQLLAAVNDFNLKSRKSQAGAEREFAGAQAEQAQTALRAAEDSLLDFLQRNRGIAGSPALALEHDRLERNVNFRQQVYTTLMQSWQEARLQEVRDTPVITILESPAIPLLPEPRGLITKSLIGAFIGAFVGIVIALLLHGISRARRAPDEEARVFFNLIQEASPRFLRRS